MKLNSQKGEVSKTIVILIVVVIVMALAVYFVIKYGTARNVGSSENNGNESGEPPALVYETQIGDVKFTLIGAKDYGSKLKAPQSTLYGQQDLITTDRFIQVTIGAQNKGKISIPQYAWKVGNIIDDQGRIFEPIDEKAYSWLPNPDLCGAQLKPEFTPTPCVKYYEVSKASKEIGIEVTATGQNTKTPTAILDIKF